MYCYLPVPSFLPSFLNFCDNTFLVYIMTTGMNSFFKLLGFFLKIYLFSLVKQTYREKEKLSERSSNYYFTLQMATTATAEPIRNQAPGASSGSPTWVQGPKELGLSLLYS